jgi:hypothetical protein
LEQVQREHRNFLIFTAIGRELSAFAVKDKIVGAIPVLYHVQAKLRRLQDDAYRCSSEIPMYGAFVSVTFCR